MLNFLKNFIFILFCFFSNLSAIFVLASSNVVKSSLFGKMKLLLKTFIVSFFFIFLPFHGFDMVVDFVGSSFGGYVSLYGLADIGTYAYLKHQDIRNQVILLAVTSYPFFLYFLLWRFIFNDNDLAQWISSLSIKNKTIEKNLKLLFIGGSNNFVDYLRYHIVFFFFLVCVYFLALRYNYLFCLTYIAEDFFNYSMITGINSIIEIQPALNSLFVAMELLEEPLYFYGTYLESFNLLDQYLNLSFDSLSCLFILLTVLIVMLCYISIDISIKNYKKLYKMLVLFVGLLLILAFSVKNILFFFICFESVLIPMIFIIGIWGSRSRKIKALYYFIFYTIFGSIFMLTGIFYLYYTYGTLNVFELANYYHFTFLEESVLWWAFFMAFAVKIPMFPFHIWLPEAHVEAPTAGSVLLAALLLKLGSYGFLRFSLVLFPNACIYYMPLLLTLSILGVVYASFIALVQLDIKRIIAYSSVAHMNFVMLGIFSLTYEGILGSIVLMVGHGFVSSALFFLIGSLYDRFHTRLLPYYGGLIQIMPIFSTFFLFFSLANLSFPGTSNFIGEFLIFFGIIQISPFITFLSGFSIFISAIYSLCTFSKICQGNLKVAFLHTIFDLSKKEFVIFFILMFFTLILGCYPSFFVTLNLEHFILSQFALNFEFNLGDSLVFYNKEFGVSSEFLNLVRIEDDSDLNGPWVEIEVDEYLLHFFREFQWHNEIQTQHVELLRAVYLELLYNLVSGTIFVPTNIELEDELAFIMDVVDILCDISFDFKETGEKINNA